jgi:ATP-dependent Lhr-like helicase
MRKLHVLIQFGILDRHRFVAGFTSEQFARPEAIDLLCAVRRAGDATEIQEVASADPLNLAGIILPGARVSRWRGRSP